MELQNTVLKQQANAREASKHGTVDPNHTMTLQQAETLLTTKDTKAFLSQTHGSQQLRTSQDSRQLPRAKLKARIFSAINGKQEKA